ncbi:MAG: S41 family peptidase [Rhodospirillales bacterium]
MSSRPGRGRGLWPSVRGWLLTALIVVPGIVACAADQGLQSLSSVVSGGAFPIPPSAQREVTRFEEVYRTYSTNPAAQPFEHFNDAFRRVRVTYVEPIDDAVLIDAAIAGVEELEGEIGSFDPSLVVEAGLSNMLASLDPHSSYLNAEEFRESRVSTSGQFGGLGIEITLENDLVKVVAPIEGTPAEAAGLAPGDTITHVDGADIRGKGLINAVNRMRGEPGSLVVITVVRGSSDAFDVKIIRDTIRVRSVRWRTEGNVGYIRVTRFTERVEPGIVRAMNELRAELGNDLSGIVLDLRNNPGGLLDQSLILADSFLEEGRIVSIKGRGGIGDRVHSASPGDMASGLPLVVLINGGAASASEIVAGALQENHRATVMGRRSFGKGSVQTITPLPIEGALRLTTARYYSPDGHSIQGNGVYPDVILALPTDAEAQPSTREADLPNALATTEAAWRQNVPVVDANRCRQAGTDAILTTSGEPDLELTCAVRFLESKSVPAFVAAVGELPQS